MSNRRKLPASNPASEMIAALDGLRAPGGCDDCDAYQEVHARTGDPNIHTIRVFHDEWCPTLARKRGGTP